MSKEINPDRLTDRQTNESSPAETAEKADNITPAENTQTVPDIPETGGDGAKAASVSEQEDKNVPEESRDGENDAPSEGEYFAAEGTDANLLSEFAPKPMNIPNIDLEKEKRRQEKRKKHSGREKKKVEARKKRGKKKKRSAGQKVAAGFACFFLFLIMSAAMAGFVAALSVQTATSKYAFRLAVDNMDVAEIPIEIHDYQSLSSAFGMAPSSSRAALVDIIRDNSQVPVTYSEIISGINSSGLESFLENRLKSASDYLLLDKPYTPMTGTDIANVVKGGATLVRNLTGKVLTDADYSNVAAYFNAGGKLDDVSVQALNGTKLRSYTRYTKVLLSLNVLGALLLINIVLLILLLIIGRNSSHSPIGWAFIVGGLAVVVCAVLFRPSHTVASGFLQAVLNSYFSFFTGTVIVIAGIFAVIGAFIFLLGNAATEKDE